ncbi:zinc finger C2HC domain-containing protein 1B [Hyperolius riggenbachi]|uniref:zinc finger C2HC domain-containing protein 1B n=1 Tax=Hyperolius riggenbachi TaxID=752182 RepID=UPI0035A2A2F4
MAHLCSEVAVDLQRCSSDEQPVLKPCKTCGRTFVEESLVKHEQICQKIFRKKQRLFNSFSQRSRGLSLQEDTQSNVTTCKHHEKENLWRQQHEQLIKAIKATKQVSKAIREGRPLPPPPPPAINPDYIQCPYCMRRFNQAAAQRHIVFCKDQAARRAMCRPSCQKEQKQLTSKNKKTDASPASCKDLSGPFLRMQPMTATCKTTQGKNVSKQSQKPREEKDDCQYKNKPHTVPSSWQVQNSKKEMKKAM